MIPRVLHRIWLGDRPMPERFESFWQSWQALNPGWEFVTWTEPPRLRNRAWYQVSRTLAGKADIARYEIVLNEGGVYVDCDEEPLRPLDELVVDHDAFACKENDDPPWIANAVIGATPGHPAVAAVVAALPAGMRRYGVGQPVHSTGPGLLTRTWATRDDVTLLPSSMFYPVHWSRMEDLGGPYPAESFGVHHWAASWRA